MKSTEYFINIPNRSNSFFSSLAKNRLDIKDGKKISFSYIENDPKDLYFSLHDEMCPTCLYIRQTPNSNLLVFTVFSEQVTPGKYWFNPNESKEIDGIKYYKMQNKFTSDCSVPIESLNEYVISQ